MIGAILAGVGLGLDLLGSFQQGKAQKEMAYYNAEVDLQNALAVEKQTDWAIARHRYDVNRLIGKQHALYGVSGVRMEGTPLKVMEETARQAELDAIAMRYQGRLKASQFRSSAALSKAQGQQAMKAAYFNMGKTLLTAGASFAGSFSPGGQSFGWSSPSSQWLANASYQTPGYGLVD